MGDLKPMIVGDDMIMDCKNGFRVGFDPGNLRKDKNLVYTGLTAHLDRFSVDYAVDSCVAPQ